MNSKDRRECIKDMLLKASRPIKGYELSKKFNVTRQIIVKDIAILRAEGFKIIATPEGYLKSERENGKFKKVIAVCHKPSEIEEELNIIIKYGGTVVDVIIEHALYGEMRGMLMIKSLFDVQNFVQRYNENNDEPLSALTGGVHLHSIEAESEDAINNIIEELKLKHFLIS